jgi:hypothetical protein
MSVTRTDCVASVLRMQKSAVPGGLAERTFCSIGAGEASALSAVSHRSIVRNASVASVPGGTANPVRPNRHITWLPASPASRTIRSRIEKLRQTWWIPVRVTPGASGTGGVSESS